MTTPTPTPDTYRTDTRTYPSVPAGGDGRPGPERPGRRRRSPGTVVAASALGVLALGGAAAGIVLATSGSSSPAPVPPVAAAAPSWTVVTPAQPAAPAHTATAGSATVPSGTASVAPRHPAPPAPPKPPAPPRPPAPSAAVETLQRELGQLSYYGGPVSGFVNPETTAAITYLQRDAHLPQTGTMNAATQQALANFLAHGNNQMGH